MATNIVATNVYQINQHEIPLANVTQIGFPSQGVLLRDCQSSPQRALNTGISVYCAVQVGNDLYYVQQTIAQMVTLFNA